MYTLPELALFETNRRLAAQMKKSVEDSARFVSEMKGTAEPMLVLPVLPDPPAARPILFPNEPPASVSPPERQETRNSYKVRWARLLLVLLLLVLAAALAL